MRAMKRAIWKPEVKPAPNIIGARIGDLEPLVKKWMERNPGVATSHLVRRGLKLALAPLAGKRHAHLVR